MTQNNILNVKLSNLQSGIQNHTGVTFKHSSNVAGDSNDENNFAFDLLLTNT